MRNTVTGTVRSLLRSSATGAAVVLLLAACDGPQRMLDTRGPAAEHIAGVWWLILGFAIFVSIAICGLALWAVWRAHQRASGVEVAEVNGHALVWGGGVIIPVILLFISLVASFRLAEDIYPPRQPPADALTIDITAHMFWWEIHYPDHGVVTANEFVIPAGQQVRLRLGSADVIHSFWVPQLHGKQDHIPGRINELWIQADSAGIFRGQCAEYCGHSHALMAMWLTALEPAEFDAWIAHRQQPPPPSLDSLAVEGRRVYADAGCGQCHATADLRLPPRLDRAGPDLADFATRRTIGAGRLPNTAENLAEWIRDPQRLKPDNRMPGTVLSDADMAALVAYLYTMR